MLQWKLEGGTVGSQGASVHLVLDGKGRLFRWIMSGPTLKLYKKFDLDNGKIRMELM